MREGKDGVDEVRFDRLKGAPHLHSHNPLRLILIFFPLFHFAFRLFYQSSFSNHANNRAQVSDCLIQTFNFRVSGIATLNLVKLGENTGEMCSRSQSHPQLSAKSRELRGFPCIGYGDLLVGFDFSKSMDGLAAGLIVPHLVGVWETAVVDATDGETPPTFVSEPHGNAFAIMAPLDGY
ncbi:hypothetical protein BCR34DRAFT_662808 [Clohesyomyces aquaticus]|uniref:Uncharacterized protein n=1 Tax=Clohesyomyces aquaticus TaxID=1231657 RepID=A0A1Y1ZV63_9PLEO|nr:hypothetical protein BCR34DRAFT_662808 [Clohesyomyces aquaticus]